MTRMLIRFMREYDNLKTSYRSGYDRLTAPEYWQKKLG